MTYTARIHQGVGAIAADDWNRMAGTDNPFVSHAFLALLEESRSVGGRSGWSPLPIVIEDAASLAPLRVTVPSILSALGSLKTGCALEFRS